MSSTKFLGIILFVLMHLRCATPNSFLSGKHFRIAYLEDPPDVIVDRDEQNNVVRVHGEAMEYVFWLSRRLNFTYELVVLNYSERSKGLLSEFQKRGIHLAVAFFMQHANLSRFAQLIFPAAYGDFTLIIPYPAREVNYLACVLPFKLEVWCCLFSSLFTVAMLLKLVTCSSKQFYPKSRLGSDSFGTFSASLIYSLSIITSQGSWFASRYRTTRIVAAIWCLAAVVLVNSYNGSLVTYLIVPKVNPLVNSVEDVANREDIRMKTMFFSVPFEVFQTASTETYKKLANKLIQHPEDRCNLIHNSDDCIATVKKGGFALAASMVEAEWLLDAEYKKRGKCELTLAREKYLPVYSGFVIPLNSHHEYRNTLDVHIMETASFGLRSHWKRKYIPRISRCSNFNLKGQKIARLTLKDLASALVILCVGLMLAIITFTFEIFLHRNFLT